MRVEQTHTGTLPYTAKRQKTKIEWSLYVSVIAHVLSQSSLSLLVDYVHSLMASAPATQLSSSHSWWQHLGLLELLQL